MQTARAGRRTVGLILTVTALLSGCTSGPSEDVAAATASFCSRIELRGSALGGGFEDMSKLPQLAAAVRSDAELFRRAEADETASKVDVVADTVEQAYEEYQHSASVFIRNEATDADLSAVGDRLSALAGVASSDYQSKEEVYELFKEIFKDQPQLVQNVNPESLPARFRVHLGDPDDFAELQEALAGLPGVDRVIRGGIETSEKGSSATTAYHELCPQEVGDTPSPSG
jgi:hypothetical protein